MSITRKGFVGLGATAVGVFAFGGAVKALGGSEDLLRPPVVLDEGDFVAKCLRCYRCVSACHTGAIVPATVDDGLLEVKTPTMDFHRGACDFCNACVEVCPTRAIQAADPASPETGRIGVAVVVPDRCLAYSSGCTVCVGECPYGALSLDGKQRPVVDEGKCNGCGICENICPALVYRSFGGGRTRGIVVVKDPASFDYGDGSGEV